MVVVIVVWWLLVFLQTVSKAYNPQCFLLATVSSDYAFSYSDVIRGGAGGSEDNVSLTCFCL